MSNGNQRPTILFPVGRLVYGSMTEGSTKKNDGSPRVDKQGQPATEWGFGVAIPKGAETHWNGTPWGKQIWDAAHAAFQQGQTQRPDFSWKIIDGDSTIPNRNNKKPCDQEGYKGHWIVRFSSYFAPRTVDAKGQSPIDPASIKRGYYVQVYADFSDNAPSQTPGMYINHRFVSLQAFGPEIQGGMDASEVGFGQAALPAGASAVPIGQAQVPASTTPNPPAAAPAPTPTTPDPSVLAAGTTTPPPPPPAAAPAPPPPPSPARTKQDRMVGGQNYDACIGAGWTDEQLIAAGHMLPA